MSTTRDPDRILRAWLDQMPSEAPDRAIDAVLLATAAAPQVRAWPQVGRWRLNPMNRPLLAAAMALVVVVAGGAYFLTRFNNPNQVGPGPTPAPTATPTPSPTPAPTTAAFGAMPSAVWGDWHADGVAIPGITAAQLVRLSLAWQDGTLGWIQLDGDGTGRQVLQFHALQAPSGEIDLRSDDITICLREQVGRYGWTRSADGLFLTLSVIDDPCAVRAATFGRTWVHSLSAVNDGGLGIIPANPWIEVKLPNERMAMSGGTDAADIHNFDQGAPRRSLLEIMDPMGFQAPCQADNKPFAINPTPTAFEAYLRTLPGLQVTASDVTIGGIAGRAFEATGLAGVTCPAGERWIFRSRVVTETDAAWSYQAGDHFFNYVVAMNGHLYLFLYDGANVTADEATSLADSIRFLTTLPVPTAPS